MDSMLLVGTNQGLLDLDTGHTLVDGHIVTALAPSPGRWHAILDRQVVVRLDDGGVMIVGELPTDDGQSLAVLADGTVVVGRTGARLVIVGAQVEEVSAFEHVPDRDRWKNPANPTPDTRSMATGGEDLWVNVHVGGLWHSGDRGESWHGVIEPGADIHEVRAQSGSVAVAAAVGFGWSEDAGNRGRGTPRDSTTIICGRCASTARPPTFRRQTGRSQNGGACTGHGSDRRSSVVKRVCLNGSRITSTPDTLMPAAAVSSSVSGRRSMSLKTTVSLAGQQGSRRDHGGPPGQN